MPLGEPYSNMIGPVGNFPTSEGFEVFVDPESGVQYEIPGAPIRQRQETQRAKDAESRAERQRQADAMRILNRISGPAPEAPRVSPFLQFDLQSRDPWRWRAAKEQSLAHERAMGGFQAQMQNREKILDQILKGQQLSRSQTFAESQAESAERKQELAEKKFEAGQPTERTAKAVKTAEEISKLRDIGAAQAGPLDIAAFASQHPGEDPLALLKEFQRLESSRIEQGRPIREEAGLEPAESASLEDLIRNIPGLGEELAGRVTPRLTTSARERVFGKRKRSKELDVLLESLSPSVRQQMFPLSPGRFGLGEIGTGGGPRPSLTGELILKMIGE